MGTFVSRAEGYDGAFGYFVDSAAQSHAAGNTLVAFISYYEDPTNPANVSSVTNTAGDSFSELGTRLHFDTNRYLQCFMTPASNGDASDVVTVSFSGAFGANNRMVAVMELSGMDASPFDGWAAANGFGASLSSGTISVSAPGMIVAVMFQTGFTFSFTAGSGYTNQGMIASRYDTEYKAVSASEDATATLPGSEFWAIFGVSLKDASVASGHPTTKRWGGVPHMGTQKLRGGHRGGPWGTTDSDLYLKRAA